MSLEVKCDWCGKPIKTYPCEIGQKHHFCGRQCQRAFRSKKTNPEHYSEYADFRQNRERFSEMNRMLNPTRMTMQTREKLRAARVNTSSGKTYTKTYGKHTHRIVAEQMLGRPLTNGEIVHHIDGNKRNNTPSNLRVMTQSEHARIHMLQRYKKEVTPDEVHSS